MFGKLEGALNKAKGALHTTAVAAVASTSAGEQSSVIADSRSQKLSIAGWELEGVSIAGQETSIIVPRAKVVFDIGRCPQRACFQQTVLISHGHLDHIGGLPFHATTRIMQGLPPSKIVVPPHYEEGVHKLMAVVKELQCDSPLEYEVLSLKPGQEMELASGFIARPFATSHSVPSQGYVLYSQRKKLKAELQNKSQEEIRAMRLAGEDVTETLQVPEIAFTGDTTAAFFDDPDAGPVANDAFRAKLLIMEMSFIDDTVSVEQAREKGHMHIADFVSQAHKFQNEAILLIHFSARYKKGEITQLLDMWLPPGLRSKVVPFLNGFAE